MKSIIRLITIAALPLWSGQLCQAQDDAGADGAAAARQAEDSARRAADVTRQQAERLRLEADRMAHRTLPAAPQAGAFTDRLQNIIRRAGGGPMSAPAKPIVIRTSPMAPKDQANLEEDLAIMSRVLDKAVEEGPGPQHTAMGIDIFSSGSTPMRNMYLDGYGAVFALHVGFPLLAPPPPPAEQKQVETQADSTWEEAREELYGQGPPGAPPPPAEEFSQAKLDQLKGRLIEALKSAANIRNLKPDESVTVCVFGEAARGGVRSRMRHTGGGGAGGSVGSAPHASWVFTDSGGGRNGTMMTIRATKSDIDSYAKGNLDREQFVKAAKVEIYPGAGGGATVVGASTGGGFGGGSQF